MKKYFVWVYLNGQLVRVSQLNEGFDNEAQAIKAAYELGHSYIVVLPVIDVTLAAVEQISLTVPRTIKAKAKKNDGATEGTNSDSE
jgi:hypothetical protein